MIMQTPAKKSSSLPMTVRNTKAPAECMKTLRLIRSIIQKMLPKSFHMHMLTAVPRMKHLWRNMPLMKMGAVPKKSADRYSFTKTAAARKNIQEMVRKISCSTVVTSIRTVSPVHCTRCSTSWILQNITTFYLSVWFLSKIILKEWIVFRIILVSIHYPAKWIWMYLPVFHWCAKCAVQTLILSTDGSILLTNANGKNISAVLIFLPWSITMVTKLTSLHFLRNHHVDGRSGFTMIWPMRSAQKETRISIFFEKLIRNMAISLL